MGEKTQISLKVDEDILQEMKKEIPNLNKFFEETSRIVLQTRNKDEDQLKFLIKTKEDEIKNIKLELAALYKRLSEIQGQDMSNSNENRTWRKIFGYYRDVGRCPQEELIEGAKLLKIDENKLEEIAVETELAFTSGDISKEDIGNWEVIKGIYIMK